MFLEIDPPAAMSELIEWFNPAGQMPDADTTVLLIVGGDVEACVGYHDGERWIEVTGIPIGAPVVCWAHMPEGPAA